MSTKAVVIPVYREDLNEFEKISLAQGRKVLKNYPLIFVAPEGKIFSYFDLGDMVAHFPAQYFQSTKTYSDLLKSQFFYEAFSDFDYMLIYQLDAFVFYDALEEFCSLGYDYIGAMLPKISLKNYRHKKIPPVGNGGFSLRNIKACHKLLQKVSESPDEKIFSAYIEDVFFSACGAEKEFDFHVAPAAVAELFAMEWHANRHVKKIGGLPFGCHFWQRFSADFYVEIFRQFGYDLQPLRAQMGNEDYQERLPILLTNVAMARLLRRIEHGQSIVNFLPTKNFSSVRVIRSPAALKILSRLLTEENFRADEIFIYDAENWMNLFRDLAREKLPHLIIVADYDASLVKGVERQGLRYGEHFISFQREYIKYCEKIFHKLGR